MIRVRSADRTWRLKTDACATDWLSESCESVCVAIHSRLTANEAEFDLLLFARLPVWADKSRNSNKKKNHKKQQPFRWWWWWWWWCHLTIQNFLFVVDVTFCHFALNLAHTHTHTLTKKGGKSNRHASTSGAQFPVVYSPTTNPSSTPISPP